METITGLQVTNSAGLTPMTYVNIGGTWINAEYVTSVAIGIAHYRNESSHWLVIELADGSELRLLHHWGFDAFKALEKLQEA